MQLYHTGSTQLCGSNPLLLHSSVNVLSTAAAGRANSKYCENAEHYSRIKEQTVDTVKVLSTATAERAKSTQSIILTLAVKSWVHMYVK